MKKEINMNKNILPLTLIGIAIALWMFSGRLFLECPFHLLTGLDCPLCGLQRFLHAMLHMRMGDACHANAWLFVLMPYCLFLLLGEVFPKIEEWKLYRLCNLNATMLCMLLLTIAWGVARNIL